MFPIEKSFTPFHISNADYFYKKMKQK